MSTSGNKRLATTQAVAWLGAGVFALGAASGISLWAFGFDALQANANGLGLPCPFQLATGFECPGCGMTRAILLAGQLQWHAAWRMNPLLVPLLGICAAAGLRSVARRRRAGRWRINAA